MLKKQETLTSVTFERVNLGKVKKTTNAQQVKDAKIALLKAQYKNNDIEVMDYLMKISSFVKNYNYFYFYLYFSLDTLFLIIIFILLILINIFCFFSLIWISIIFPKKTLNSDQIRIKSFFWDESQFKKTLFLSQYQKRRIKSFFDSKVRRETKKELLVLTTNKTVNGPYFDTIRFAIKIENGKRFCFCYGAVRAFLP